MTEIDLSVLETPGPEGAAALCEEVAAVMSALGIESGPTRVEDGTKIQSLGVEVPFCESEITRNVGFLILAERQEVAFATPPRAGLCPTNQQIKDNPDFMRLVRDAAVARLFEVGLQVIWGEGGA